MKFDPETLETSVVYKLLVASVTPRPIAWVTTQDSGGRVNAAPYSFFNAMGSNPPTVAIGLLADPGKGFKDSARNILDTGEFVVNLVPDRLREEMNLTAVGAPHGLNELDLAGLDSAPSQVVTPPRIAQSPVALECVTLSAVVTGPHQTIVIGRVVQIHIDDTYVLNAERGHVDAVGLDLIGRSYGSQYIRTRDRFDMVRPTWEGWLADHPDFDPEA